MRLLRLPGVFQPHSDSMMLAECLERERLHPWCSVLDLCTGSGLLAVSAAHRASCVVAVDVSWRALLAVRANARLNGVVIQAVHGDLFSAVPNQRFDVIVSNPPYLPGPGPDLPRRGPARAWEAGPRGRSFLDRICTQTRAHLRPGGVLLLVHSSVCSVPETLRSLSQQDLNPRIVATHEGPLGPRLRSRPDWLRRQGLLLDGDQEQLVVIRAQRPPAGGETGMVPSRCGSRAMSGNDRQEQCDGQGSRAKRQE